MQTHFRTRSLDKPYPGLSTTKKDSPKTPGPGQPGTEDSMEFSNPTEEAKKPKKSWLKRVGKGLKSSIPFVTAALGATVGATLGAIGGAVGGATGAVAGITLGVVASVGVVGSMFTSLAKESPALAALMLVFGLPVVGAVALTVGGASVSAGLALGMATGAAGGVVGGALGAAGGATLGGGLGAAVKRAF